MDWSFTKNNRVDVGDLQSYLKSKGVDCDVSQEQQDNGTFVVTIHSAIDPTPFLASYVPSQRGKKRSDMILSIQSAGTIAQVRQILISLLDNIRFDDD